MSRREKIILSIMFCAVVYGGFELLIRPRSEPSAKDVPADLRELERRMKGLGKAVPGLGLSSAEGHVLRMAGTPWAGDPFLASKLPSEIAEEAARKRAAEEERRQEELARSKAERDRIAAEQAWVREMENQFRYLGYVVTKGERFAIINGVEYRVGAELEVGGCVLQSIADDRVTLKPKARDTTIEVLLEE